MTDFAYLLPGDHAQAGPLRAAVREWLAQHLVAPDLLGDVLLAVTELFANAVDSLVAQTPVEVRLRVRDGLLFIEVTNVGPGFDPAAVPRPSVDRLRGRGLAIAQAIGDLTVRHSGGRTTVAVAVAAGDVSGPHGTD